MTFLCRRTHKEPVKVIVRVNGERNSQTLRQLKNRNFLMKQTKFWKVVRAGREVWADLTDLMTQIIRDPRYLKIGKQVCRFLYLRQVLKTNTKSTRKLLSGIRYYKSIWKFPNLELMTLLWHYYDNLPQLMTLEDAQVDFKTTDIFCFNSSFE